MALFLNTAQVFRYESVRGRVTWETTRSYFDDCEASLKNALLDERERNEIRAACLIDGAPCRVELPRDRLERKEGSAAEVCAGIDRARQDTEKGIALAKQCDLGQFVHHGEVNLLRLDAYADEYGCD